MRTKESLDLLIANPRTSNQTLHETEGWYDVAAFLFGVIIRAHSFSDGNGHVARAAYAMAIIKGGLAFAALGH
jgi:prophage maintenance system killer protein